MTPSDPDPVRAAAAAYLNACGFPLGVADPLVTGLAGQAAFRHAIQEAATLVQAATVASIVAALDAAVDLYAGTDVDHLAYAATLVRHTPTYRLPE